MLILAVHLHLGITITIGALTANRAFVPPSLVRRILDSDSDQAAENEQVHSRKNLPPKIPGVSNAFEGFRMSQLLSRPAPLSLLLRHVQANMRFHFFPVSVH